MSEALLRKLVTDCQDDLAQWIVPDSTISNGDVINMLLGRLDGSQAREALAPAPPTPNLDNVSEGEPWYADAPTEQTEAQDDGMPFIPHTEVAESLTAIEAAACIESLRAQLEAARELAIDRELELSAHRVESSTLRADLAQKMQEHQDALSEMRGRMEGAERDAARLDAIESGAVRIHIDNKNKGRPTYWAFRGVHSHVGFKLRDTIDAALSTPSAGAV